MPASTFLQPSRLTFLVSHISSYIAFIFLMADTGYRTYQGSLTARPTPSVYSSSVAVDESSGRTQKSTSIPVANRPSQPSYCYSSRNDRHYRSDLNNIAKRYGLKIDYEYEQDGPDNNCKWTSVVYVGGIPYGSGTSRDKGGAKEIASKGAVESLESQGYI